MGDGLYRHTGKLFEPSSYRYFMVGQRTDGTVVAMRARNGELHFDGDDVEKILEKLDSDNKAVI